MSFFIRTRKSNRDSDNKGLYLQIAESFWDPSVKAPRQRIVQTLGYESDLRRELNLEDPLTHFREVAGKMSRQAKEKRAQQRRQLISESPKRNIGYFVLQKVYDKLGVSKYLDTLQQKRDFQFSLSRLVEGLIYARVVMPSSKKRTLESVFPLLYGDYSISYDQMLSGIAFCGECYQKIISIFTHQVRKHFGVDMSTTYMDCTNFYFEIDRQDELRRKGPSKENRHEPIVGLALLLDAAQIPVNMEIFPGNESEKPRLRDMIRRLKETGGITGRTIQVADKGLNCAENIVAAIEQGDGYLFSKSVRQLPQTEQNWVLLQNGFTDVSDENGELRYRYKSCTDDFSYRFPGPDGRPVQVMLPEKRVVTFNPSLRDKQLLEINRMVEKAKALNAARAKRDQYGDCGKYVEFRSVDETGKASTRKAAAVLKKSAVEKDRRLAGYNLLVTSEVRMSEPAIYATYHTLWRIEESFRVFKSYLDSRPVFLQNPDAITGHFLICYLGVLLLRLLQIHLLRDVWGSEQLVHFIRELEVARCPGGEWLNLANGAEIITELGELFDVPINCSFLTKHELDGICH